MSDARCLFTDRILTVEQAREHAPPRALGGRFVSRWSTSTDFNHRAGETDDHLINKWLVILNEMAPAMSKDAAEAKRRIVARRGGDEVLFHPGGFVSATGVTLKYGVDGRPAGLKNAPDVSAARAALRSIEPRAPRATLALTIEPIGDPHLTIAMEISDAWTEVAAAKTCIVVQDCLARHAPDGWVRSSATQEVRRMVGDWVATEDVDKDLGGRSMLGINYGWREELVGLADRANRSRGRFDHTFFACGNAGRRTIDLAWLVFGHEPMAIRLTRTYRGPDFLTVAGCDPLKHGRYWGPVGVTGHWYAAERGYSSWFASADPTRELGGVVVRRRRQDLYAEVMVHVTWLDKDRGARWLMSTYLANYNMKAASGETIIRTALERYYDAQDIERAMAVVEAGVRERTLFVGQNITEKEGAGMVDWLHVGFTGAVEWLIRNVGYPRASREGVSGPSPLG